MYRAPFFPSPSAWQADDLKPQSAFFTTSFGRGYRHESRFAQVTRMLMKTGPKLPGYTPNAKQNHQTRADFYECCR
jgi:hypothetical protein